MFESVNIDLNQAIVMENKKGIHQSDKKTIRLNPSQARKIKMGGLMSKIIKLN